MVNINQNPHFNEIGKGSSHVVLSDCNYKYNYFFISFCTHVFSFGTQIALNNCMFKFILHKIMGVALIWMLLPVSGASAWDGMDSVENRLFLKINQARISPDIVFDELGLDREKILNAHPFLIDYMDGGFPEFMPDERLFSSAASHAEEMAVEKYFSKISLDGSAPADRFKRVQYHALESGEVLGVVLFQKYLSMDKALDALCQNIIQNDLDWGKESSPILFNPNFKEIGLSIQSGFILSNGVRLNFYLAVVDLGSDGVSLNEKKSFVDLNLARTSPDQYLMDAAFDQDNGGGNITLNLESQAPLAFDVGLYLKAKKTLGNLIEDMTGSFVLNVSGDAPDSDLLEIPSVGVSKIWITVDEKNPEEAQAYLLEQALMNEVSLAPEERVLLNPDYSTAGLVFVSGPIVFNDTDEYFINAMAVEAALPPEVPKTYELSGLVYEDKDKNGQYTPGEGCPSALLRVVNENGESSGVSFFTGELGEFSVQLESGEYGMKGCPLDQTEYFENKVRMTDHNLFILHGLEQAEK